jgi:hypothetical protein
MLGVFERIRKWTALRSYRSKLPLLLVKRYGYEQQYTPAQVLTTIKLHELNLRYAPYACAMFCSKQAYGDFVAMRRSTAEAKIAPSDMSAYPLWSEVGGTDWPAHHEITTELHHSVGYDSPWADAGHSHHDGGGAFDGGHHAGADYGGGYDGGGDSGGGYDGGAGSGSD